MTLNQRVVAVVTLSFELWFGGRKSSREFIQRSEAMHVFGPSLFLKKHGNVLRTKKFSHDEAEGMEGRTATSRLYVLTGVY